MIDLGRLKNLYTKTNGGHTLLPEDEFIEYGELRRQEYQERKAELIANGCTDIHPVKDSQGDIVGWVFSRPIIL